MNKMLLVLMNPEYQPVSRFFKGLLVGIIIVLPGMSGGTLVLILGLYESLMRDLSRFRFTPWITFGLGLAAGMLVSGTLLSWLFTAYTEIILAVLLGCILASVRTVIGKKFSINYVSLAALLAGLTGGYLLSSSSDLTIGGSDQPHLVFVFLIASLASAAMILPGVPGSSVLIIAGIYDNMMNALASFDWLVLLVFTAGAVTGLFALSNLFSKLYSRYHGILSWLFAGLIIGSGRMLIPEKISQPLVYFLACLAGFALVWFWDSKSRASVS